MNKDLPSDKEDDFKLSKKYSSQEKTDKEEKFEGIVKMTVKEADKPKVGKKRASIRTDKIYGISYN
jgi:hypothetical protein